MSANYERPSFDPEIADKLRKPQRGSMVAERDETKAAAKRLEEREKGKVRKRDPRCRIPIPHECRFSLECAHIRDASLGGEMSAANMVRACGWMHRRGPVSIHGKQLQVRPETTAGADGPLSFWLQDVNGEYYLAAREIRPYQIERD